MKVFYIPGTWIYTVCLSICIFLRSAALKNNCAIFGKNLVITIVRGTSFSNLFFVLFVQMLVTMFSSGWYSWLYLLALKLLFFLVVL